MLSQMEHPYSQFSTPTNNSTGSAKHVFPPFPGGKTIPKHVDDKQ